MPLNAMPAPMDFASEHGVACASIFFSHLSSHSFAAAGDGAVGVHARHRQGNKHLEAHHCEAHGEDGKQERSNLFFF